MVEIIKINPDKPDSGAIKVAAEIIKKGGLVVYPTDTVYGLGANAFDAKAVRKVISAKSRNPEKPISIAFESLAQVKKYARFDPLSLKIAEKFLPGPLTLILPKKGKIPKELNPDEKIRVRIIDHPVVSALLKKTKVPITSTSANLSGGKNPCTAKEAVDQIGDKVDVVLDCGKCKIERPSTIAEVVGKDIVVWREGIIKKSDLV